MIFATKNAIQQIVSGAKVQTRRLIKENEMGLRCYIDPIDKGDMWLDSNEIGDIVEQVVTIKKNKVKWQVGKNYAVQSGRGKRGLFYCPKCFKNGKKEYLLQQVGTKGQDLSKVEELCWHEPYHTMKPLRIVITNIRKERLLNIDEVDAKKEGYRCKFEFLANFCRLNKIRACWQYPPSSGYKIQLRKKLFETCDWFGIDKNPFVWVLSFKVVDK